MDDSRRCTAKSKQSGQRCKRAAIVGGTVCKMHGGGTKAAKAKAAARSAQIKAEEKAQRMVAQAGVDVDPIEHLIDSLHRASALVEVWGAMVAELDTTAESEAESKGIIRGDLRHEPVKSEKFGGVDIAVTPNDRLLTVDNRGQAGVHPFIVQYEGALDRKAKFAKLCIDAGVEQRQVELYEQQVEIAYRGFEAALEALGLTDDQKQTARRAYADHLRSP